MEILLFDIKNIHSRLWFLRLSLERGYKGYWVTKWLHFPIHFLNFENIEVSAYHQTISLSWCKFFDENILRGHLISDVDLRTFFLFEEKLRWLVMCALITFRTSFLVFWFKFSGFVSSWKFCNKKDSSLLAYQEKPSNTKSYKFLFTYFRCRAAKRTIAMKNCFQLAMGTWLLEFYLVMSLLEFAWCLLFLTNFKFSTRFRSSLFLSCVQEGLIKNV